MLSKELNSKLNDIMGLGEDAMVYINFKTLLMGLEEVAENAEDPLSISAKEFLKAFDLVHKGLQYSVHSGVAHSVACS